MTPEEWQCVRPILESALELDPVGRPSFLDRACPTPGIRSEVESLIASHDQAATHALKVDSLAEFDCSEEILFRLSPGKRIGPYEVIEEIAVGGMGAVYRAVRADGQYQQQVALKIVRSELGAEPTVVRFRNERQILASLDHPNIAKILDGASTVDGLPYFVMELIDGQPITDYCHRHRLSIEDRLKLFRSVCSAVHYAHQRLVVHRDIKPANILITSNGVAKLLDFGIAKILDPSLLVENISVTAPGFWIMTPEYASPEQLRGEPITTATDVYALGLVLYELLTGRHAYRFPSHLPHEIARVILNAEPEKPSAALKWKDRIQDANANRAVRLPEIVSSVGGRSSERLRYRINGDLDNIVLKAIRKDPRQRYSSADQLSDDIRRHLEHLPILARKSSLSYRCRKYILRHKFGVVAAAVLFASLMAGMGLTLREARVARANQLRAERRFNEVRALANSLLFEVHDGIRYLPGSTSVRELLVRNALRYLDSLSQEAGGDRSLQRELAAAYDRVGDLEYSTDYANQGDTAGALASYRKALAIRESLAALNPKDSTLQLELAGEYFRLADTLEATGNFPRALELFGKIPPLARRILDTKHSFRVHDCEAGGYYYMGRVLLEMGDSAAALEYHRKALAIRESPQVADSREARLLTTHLAGDYAGIAEAMASLGKLDEAVQMQSKTIQILEELLTSDPNSAPLHHFLGNSYGLLGTIWEKRGNPSKALQYRRQGHMLFARLAESDPQNALARKNFAFSDENLGRSLIAVGKTREGLHHLREGLATFEAMVNNAASDRYVSSGLAESYFQLGNAYSVLATNTAISSEQAHRNWREARSWFQKSADVLTAKSTHGTLDYEEREKRKRLLLEIDRCSARLIPSGRHNRNLTKANVKY
jgi:eukaryotic-like serine/threonine-protein kinase